jgi:hypothetical protein
MLNGMKTIELQVPDSLLLQPGESLADLARTSQILLAIKFYELGKLSSGQAAKMCNMTRVDFLLELGRLGRLLKAAVYLTPPERPPIYSEILPQKFALPSSRSPSDLFPSRNLNHRLV